MEQFNTLQELLMHLEDDAVEYRYGMYGLFNKLTKEKKKNETLWEMFFLQVEPKEGEISGFNAEHLEKELNDKLSSQKCYKYLQKRAKESQNPILVAQYYHLLWLGPKKHNEFAKEAVSSYLKQVDVLENEDKKQPDKHYGLDVLDALLNAFHITRRAKLQTDDIVNKILWAIKKFNSNSTSILPLRLQLIELTLKYPKLFPKSKLKGISLALSKTGKLMKERKNLNAAIDVYRLAEKVDDKLSINRINWQGKIADSYKQMLEEREVGDPVRPTFCLDAIDAYKKAGDTKKAVEMEQRYQVEREKIKLQEISHEIDMAETYNRFQEIADKLSEEPLEKIMSVLYFDKSLLPSVSDIRKRSENDGTIAFDVFPAQTLDGRGNVSAGYFGDDATKHFKVLHTYSVYLSMHHGPFLGILLSILIKKEKLAFAALKKLLQENSWIAVLQERPLPNGGSVQYEWLSLCAPSIEIYFNEYQALLADNTYTPSLIMPIDSLILKFEGMIRDLLVINGGVPFVQKKHKQGGTVVQEKDINVLLHSKERADLFDEDDLFFIKYILIEKAGYNIRHEIAHALVAKEDYTIGLMNLLFIALLRIAKFQFVKKKSK